MFLLVVKFTAYGNAAGSLHILRRFMRFTTLRYPHVEFEPAAPMPASVMAPA